MLQSPGTARIRSDRKRSSDQRQRAAWESPRPHSTLALEAWPATSRACHMMKHIIHIQLSTPCDVAVASVEALCGALSTPSLLIGRPCRSKQAAGIESPKLRRIIKSTPTRHWKTRKREKITETSHLTQWAWQYPTYSTDCLESRTWEYSWVWAASLEYMFRKKKSNRCSWFVLVHVDVGRLCVSITSWNFLSIYDTVVNDRALG